MAPLSPTITRTNEKPQHKFHTSDFNLESSAVGIGRVARCAVIDRNAAFIVVEVHGTADIAAPTHTRGRAIRGTTVATDVNRLETVSQCLSVR